MRISDWSSDVCSSDLPRYLAAYPFPCRQRDGAALMNIDIQAEAITPRRHTFSHIARRFGVDKPASRYEEATFDVQPVANFHYRPTSAPEFELYDPARTRLLMAAWVVFRRSAPLY